MSILYAIWPHPCLMEWAIKRYSRGTYQERLLRGTARWGYEPAHSDASYGSSRSTLLRRIRQDGQISHSLSLHNPDIRVFKPWTENLVLMVEVALAQDHEGKKP